MVIILCLETKTSSSLEKCSVVQLYNEKQTVMSPTEIQTHVQIYSDVSINIIKYIQYASGTHAQAHTPMLRNLQFTLLQLISHSMEEEEERRRKMKGRIIEQEEEEAQ